MEPCTRAVQWLSILFLNGSETGVVSGEPYPSLEVRQKRGGDSAGDGPRRAPARHTVAHLCVRDSAKESRGLMTVVLEASVA